MSYGKIMAGLTGGIFRVVAWAYNMVLQFAYQLFSDNITQFINKFISTIYTLVGIFMLFRIVVSLLQYLVDPNKISDKQVGGGKLIVRIITSIVLLLTLNTFIFPLLNDLQLALIGDGSEGSGAINQLINKLNTNTFATGVVEDDIGSFTLVDSVKAEEPTVFNCTYDLSDKDLSFKIYVKFTRDNSYIDEYLYNVYSEKADDNFKKIFSGSTSLKTYISNISSENGNNNCPSNIYMMKPTEATQWGSIDSNGLHVNDNFVNNEYMTWEDVFNFEDPNNVSQKNGYEKIAINGTISGYIPDSSGGSTSGGGSTGGSASNGSLDCYYAWVLDDSEPSKDYYQSGDASTDGTFDCDSDKIENITVVKVSYYVDGGGAGTVPTKDNIRANYTKISGKYNVNITRSDLNIQDDADSQVDVIKEGNCPARIRSLMIKNDTIVPYSILLWEHTPHLVADTGDYEELSFGSATAEETLKNAKMYILGETCPASSKYQGFIEENGGIGACSYWGNNASWQDYSSSMLFAHNLAASFITSNADCESDAKCKNAYNCFIRDGSTDEKVGEYIDKAYIGESLFVGILGGVVAIVFLFVLMIEVVVRNMKLILLQCVSPVAAVAYMNPQDKIFNQWVKMYMGTYADLFLKLIGIQLAFAIAAKFVQSFVNPGLLVILIWFGAFTFAKTVPNLISKLFGIEDMGGTMKDSFGLLKGAAGIGAAALGLGAINMARNGVGDFMAAKRAGLTTKQALTSGVYGAGAGLKDAIVGAPKGFRKSSAQAKANRSARQALIGQGMTAGTMAAAHLPLYGSSERKEYEQNKVHAAAHNKYREFLNAAEESANGTKAMTSLNASINAGNLQGVTEADRQAMRDAYGQYQYSLATGGKALTSAQLRDKLFANTRYSDKAIDSRARANANAIAESKAEASSLEKADNKIMEEARDYASRNSFEKDSDSLKYKNAYESYIRKAKENGTYDQYKADFYKADYVAPNEDDIKSALAQEQSTTYAAKDNIMQVMGLDTDAGASKIDGKAEAIMHTVNEANTYVKANDKSFVRKYTRADGTTQEIDIKEVNSYESLSKQGSGDKKALGDVNEKIHIAETSGHMANKDAFNQSRGKGGHKDDKN